MTIISSVTLDTKFTFFTGRMFTFPKSILTEFGQNIIHPSVHPVSKQHFLQGHGKAGAYSSMCDHRKYYLDIFFNSELFIGAKLRKYLYRI